MTPTDSMKKARAGSHTAFRSLVKPYQAELRRHCYRMTGSVDDADDLVQETLLRAWRNLGTYRGRGSFRAWLYKIATNQTLDLLGSAQRRSEVVNSAGEPAWLQPIPDVLSEAENSVVELETIGLAFVSALQQLTGGQRSALILRDVLGFSAVEAAEITGTSVASLTSALQRARSNMANFSLEARTAGTTAEQRQVVDDFLKAWRQRDTKRLVDLLHETSHMTMPPYEMEVLGSQNIVDFMMEQASEVFQLREVTANGQPGVTIYPYREEVAQFTCHCVMFFESSATSITKITGFRGDHIFTLLGLPETVEQEEK